MSTDPSDPGTVDMFPDAPRALAPRPPARVYVVQETNLNLAKATKFGELSALLPGRTNITMQTQPVIRELRRKLKEFSDHDYILPLGDPVAIGLVFMVAMDINNGKVRALKWDNEMRDYYVVNVDFYDRGGNGNVG